MLQQQSHNGGKLQQAGIDPDRDDGFAITAVALDFSNKTIDELSVTAIDEAIRTGKYVWIDLDYSDAEVARTLLSGLKLVDNDLVEEIFTEEEGTELSRHPNYMHLVLSGCRLAAGGELELQRIDTVIDEKFFLTVHRGVHDVIDAVKNEYQGDFVRFAHTPSFLIYELWDALVEHYADIEKHLEQEVESLQSKLVRAADDEVFSHVSDIGENLLQFRGILMPARKIITELASRRSHLVS